MMRRCISGALKATETALVETLRAFSTGAPHAQNGRSARLVKAMKPATAPSALKVQAVLGECWNSRLERARRRTLPRPSIVTSGRPVLVVAPGDKGVDDKKAAAVIGEKIGRVNADFAREITGFAICGVPPVGHARPPIVLIDETLLRFDNIWAAAGTPYAVFRLTPADLVALTRGLVVDAANS
jgi:hypothetical protein